MRWKTVPFIFALVLADAGAQTVWSEGAIKNLGSGAALVMECEREGYLPIGTASDYLVSIRSALPPADSVAVKNQFQASLHEKKMYSMAKDRWYPFRTSDKECRDLAKTLPSVLHHIEKFKN